MDFSFVNKSFTNILEDNSTFITHLVIAFISKLSIITVTIGLIITTTAERKAFDNYSSFTISTVSIINCSFIVVNTYLDQLLHYYYFFIN